MGKGLSLNILEIARKVEKLEKSGGSGGGGAAEDITYDNTDSGLTADTVQGAIDEVAGDIEGLSADDVTYDNTDSGLIAETVQGAIDELADKLPSDEYVSVTADGVKTTAQVLNDLFAAADLTKLTPDSKVIRITSTATVSYHIVEYTSSAAYFSYDIVTADHWQIITFILKNNDSSCRQVYDGSKVDKSSEVPADGTIYRIYY